MLKPNKSLLGLLLFVLSLTCTAQNISFFTSKQGLVNSCIQTLYEDSRHNIWIGTRDGLNRYDGVKMNTYRHSEANPNSLLSNIVLCIYEYDTEHILIGTGSGIQAYSYATDQFTHVPFITVDGDTLPIYISNITRLSSGKVVACIAGHGSGWILHNDKGNLYAQQETKYATGNNHVSPGLIFEDKEQNLWIINNEHEVYLMPKGKGEGIPVDVPDSPRNFCMGASGKIYLGCEQAGLLVYDKQAGRFVPVSPGDGNYNLWNIRPWTDGRIFICTDGHGLKIYDEQTGKITQSTIQTNDFSLATANVKDAVSDLYGNVWIGIYWRGVMMKPINQSAFEYMGRNSITKNSIGTNPVTAIAPGTGDKLWVATDHGGLYKVANDGATSYHWDPETVKNMPSTINALYESADGTLWMGGYFDGLWSMNTQTGNFTRSRHNVNRISAISQDPSGDLWIATLGKGFYRYNPHTDVLTQYTNNNGNIESASFIDPNRFIYCIQAHAGQLYVGTANGLEIYKLGRQKLVPLRVVQLRSNILCMKFDQKGSLWFGNELGLHRLNIKANSVKSYTENSGLPNLMVNSIELQGDNLWIGTNNGLSRFNSKAETFENFFNEDGLQDNEFGQRVSTTAGGNLYFGGLGGITFFHETNIEKLRTANSFKIFLVDFYVNNKAVHKGDKSGSHVILDGCIDETQAVNLAYNDNHFSVEVSAPHVSGRHIDYEYSFDGKNWQTQEGNTRHIIIQGLEPGLYKLRIRARSNQTLSEVRTLTITVHHPWYTSPLALGVYLVLGVLALWAISSVVRRQVTARHILQRHKQEREINEARIQFFMNISHEIRTPMTLIMAPLEKLMGMDSDEPHQRNYHLIHQNAKRILRLVNQLMDVRKIEKGQYRLEYTTIDLIPFIQNICDVFASATQQRNIEFHFRHNVDAVLVQTDTENLDKILMNLLSNAFKFTPNGGAISVNLDAQPHRLLLRVIDNGSGIREEDKPKIFERFYSASHQNGYIGTGIGLNLTYLLVGLFKGTITVADNPIGQGTMFVIDLPRIDGKKQALPSDQPEATDTPDTSDQSDPSDVAALPVEKRRGMKHRNVLIVEDDPSIRQYLHSELSHDMVISEMGDGAKAWEYIQKNPQKVDLVISDRMMPGLDGLSLCQRIKQNPLTNHLPVILITALGSDADRIEGLQGGADAYVSKPFNIDVLRTTALNLLQSRLMLQGKFTTEQKTEEKIEKVELTSPDEHLMERVMRVINQNMDNADLSVEAFADLVGISRVHFYRKIKELTGQSPRDFLKTIRLKEAARLLKEKHLDITSVSDATGFKTLSTFSTSFKALYGMTPSEYQNSGTKES